MFVMLSSYFPYTARLCINGILSCADPALAQYLADSLTAERLDDLRKWLRCLPHPFTRDDRRRRHPLRGVDAAYRSSRLRRSSTAPPSGRVFFEEVIRENLDLGRPDPAQLTFDRRFHLPVLTDAEAVPSLLER